MTADGAGSATPTEMLTEVAKAQQPAVLFSTGLTRPCAGHFQRVADGVVTLSLLSDLEDDALQMLSLCFVGFHYARRTRVFVAQVLEYGVVAGRREVGLAIPQEIASQEARLALRVPVEEVEGFAVGVHFSDGRQLHPTAINVSMSGMLVRFGASDPALGIGDRVRVEIALSGETVALDEVAVRRRDGSDYGLFFTTTLSDGKVDPPEPLERIVATLQRRYIAESSG